MLPFPVVIRAQSYDEYHDNASIIRYIIVNVHTILMYVTPAESGDCFSYILSRDILCFIQFIPYAHEMFPQQVWTGDNLSQVLEVSLIL